MKIILLQDEKKLGKKGDIIEASEGYARNYILPKKIGVEANAKNMNDLKLQTMRKEADFEVMDKIRVTYEGSEKAEAVFAKYAESIGSDVLADDVAKAAPEGYVKAWKINGEDVTIGVRKM